MWNGVTVSTIMKLIPCPACANPLSPEAELCPQCGHPTSEHRVSAPRPEPCYKCGAAATQRCVHCEAFSCAAHLNNYANQHGGVLLCTTCGERQEGRNRATMALIVIVSIILLAIVAASNT